MATEETYLIQFSRKHEEMGVPEFVANVEAVCSEQSASKELEQLLCGQLEQCSVADAYVR